MTATTTDSITRDNLIVVAPKNDLGVTVDSGETIARGCVVGRVKVAAGTLVGPTGTGNGAGSAFALASGGPAKIGNYLATCIEAVTHGGIFRVTDPDGVDVGQAVIPEGTGNAVTFEGGGIVFTITDGSTDFIVGDYFTLPVAAGDLEMVACDHTAVDGSEIPEGVLSEAVAAGGVVTMYTDGTFQSTGLTFGGSSVYTDLRDAMRDNGMFIKVTNASANLGG